MDNPMGPTNKTAVRLLRICTPVFCWLLALPSGTLAHPMGNFSINHYSGIRIEQNFVELRYLIDMAEIPTFQELQQNNIVAQSENPHVRAYLAARAESFRENLFLAINRRPLALEIESKDILFTPGAGQLPTMKIGLVLRVNLQETQLADVNDLRYSDTNFPGHAGWKEVVATSGTQIEILASSVPAQDRSTQRTNYPTDLLSSPPQQLEARLTFRSARSTQGAMTATPQLKAEEPQNAG